MLKKWTTLAALVLAMALLLTGCVQGGDAVDPNAEPTATLAPLTEPMYTDREALYQYYNAVTFDETLTSLTEKYGEPVKEEGREQLLVRLLAEKKAAEPGVLRVSTEKNLYQCLNLKIKSDLFVSSTEGITLYEAKAGGSKAEDLYQLRMYHDGCVADGMEVREAVLIAQRHPDTVRALLAELNSQKDKNGRPYHFVLSTWDEEGIVLPPDAA